MLVLIRHFSRFLLIVCVLLGTSASALAAAHDHITQRAYWEDASGQATFEQAQQQTFTPYEGVLGRGYTQSAIWTKFEIVPPTNAKPDDQLILRIRPIYLDQIRLYDPLDLSGHPRIVGDQTSYKDEEYKSLAHAFVIPAGQAPRFIWLRLQATSTTLMHVEALAFDDMQRDEHRLMLNNFFTLSLITVCLLIAIINWFNYKEFLYAAFVIRNFIYLIYTAAFFGLHRYLLDDSVSAHHIDLAYNWLIVGTTAFSFWFEIHFISEYEPPPWVQYIFRGMLLWSAVNITLLCLGYTHLSLKLNMTLTGTGVVLMLVLSAIFIDDNRTITPKTASLLKKKFMVGYYAIIAALLMVTVLPYLGAIAGSEFSANGLVYYSIVSGIEMTILMELRTRQMRKVNIQMSQDLNQTAQQVLIEKNRREESTQLLTMLMHELKNPLAVIDLAQQTSEGSDAKDYVSRNVSIIRNVLDQCLSADRLSDGKINIEKQNVDVIEIIDDITDEKQSDDNTFQLHYAVSPITLRTDYQCLRIVLSNLIDNALRYGDTSQAIGIDVRAQNNAQGQPGIAICVANKPGMASWPEADKVFHKYYRSTGAKTISGTGLGLFLVRSICTLLDGTCTYEPDDTHVRFSIWLPN